MVPEDQGEVDAAAPGFPGFKVREEGVSLGVAEGPTR